MYGKSAHFLKGTDKANEGALFVAPFLHERIFYIFYNHAVFST